VTDINFVETDTLFLSDVKANIDKQINLQLPDHDINLKFSDTEIKVFATIEKFTEGKLKIPITVKNVPEGISFKYFPRAVTVSYYTSLSSFKGIDENDFSVVCDYDMITENQSFLIPEIIEKPQSVKNAKILNKRIDFIITE
jgi:YbbR domain-containing protein